MRFEPFFGKRNLRLSTGTGQWNFRGMSLADVKFFRIWHRKVQRVTFENIATAPVTIPSEKPLIRNDDANKAKQ